MGVVDTIFNSIVVVVAGLLGISLMVAGGREAALGSQSVGTVMFILGIVSIVFATRY